MLTFYNICFWLGVALAGIGLISTIFGLADIFNLDFDFDFDFGVHGLDFWAFLPLKPTLMIVFLAFLGGAGKLLSLVISPVLGLVPALICGFSAVFAVNKLIVRPLEKAAAVESIDDLGTIGMSAVVTEKIFENGFGQVTFIYDGNTISGPAKTVGGEEIPVNTNVVILEVVDSVYMVKKLE